MIALHSHLTLPAASKIPLLPYAVSKSVSAQKGAHSEGHTLKDIFFKNKAWKRQIWRGCGGKPIDSLQTCAAALQIGVENPPKVKSTV